MATLCNGNPKNFSGISARKGSLTTAISAGVLEEIVFLQSGHEQTRAARAYMHLQDPDRMFDDTFKAFGLRTRQKLGLAISASAHYTCTILAAVLRTLVVWLFDSLC